MCVFCDIAASTTEAYVVYEDELCMAFLDSDPICEGHVLLIPKEHYLDADEIPAGVFAHMARVSQRLIAAIKHAYAPDGYSVMQNGGKFNDVGHYHQHIFPRNAEDGFGWKDADGTHRCDAAIAENIRKMI